MKVKVSAKCERFRRAGMEFTREPVEVDVDKDTLDILEAEPMLSVQVLDDKTKKAGADPNDPDKKKGKGNEGDPNDPNKKGAGK